MATVSYGLRVVNENHVFDETLKIYRKAVSYLTEIAMTHYEDLLSAGEDEAVKGNAGQKRMKCLERLVHGTSKRKAVYERFDREFYKFPSYLRRSAIMTAIGSVMSYRSQVENWIASGKKGKKPFLNRNRNAFPCFYHGNMYHQEGVNAELKLFDGHDWIWHAVTVRKTDWDYVKKHMSGWTASAPVFSKRGHRYELRIAYTSKSSKLPKFVKDREVSTVIGVDLGINNDAVCSVVGRDGTVTGQKFINSPVEKDRMYTLLNVIKKAQRNGNRKTPRLWRNVNSYNRAIAIKTAREIVKFAKENKAEVIVFEHLGKMGKLRGSRKQKISLWRKRDIQTRVEALASRNGIRVSYVCAVNTSRLAFDGSGKVLRGFEAGFATNELCRFTNGKVYNCDLSASKNIAARYFIRVLTKSVPEKVLLSARAKVPELGTRTSCVLATLISFSAVAGTTKAA